VLTPLQEKVARILSALPEAHGFALAGGAAVISRGIVDRSTRDLDFFGAEASEVNQLAAALTTALRAENFLVQATRDNPGFVRLHVAHEGRETTVDIGTDARMQEAEDTSLGATLTTEELAADKLLALFSRAQARDFVDVAALTEIVGGLDRICALAQEKDSGFSRSVLGEMLGGFDRLPRTEFPLDDERYEGLRAEVRNWQTQLLRSSDDPTSD